MPACKHANLEFVGNQKTDDGVNAYYKCKSCGILLIMTPSRQVFGVRGVQPEHPPAGNKGTKS